MCLEVCFDPSSRFVAVGTADSHVKVFDINKAFQTHNFLGHRGVICRLAFMPGVDTLKLVSAAEDFNVKVWDLVLNKELANLKGNRGRVSAFQFTKDFKTLIVGSRDGKIVLYNAQDQFRQIESLELSELGSVEEEVTCMEYIWISSEKSMLAVGGSLGQLCVIDLSSLRITYAEKQYIASELTFIYHVTPTGDESHQLVTGNFDQNLSTYNLVNKQLRKVSSKCLYLDEVIDIKVFKPQNEYALMCSNSETLKLLCFETGEVEMYTGHDDLILCLDISGQYCLSGAKDNTVRMWRYDLQAEFERKLACVAVFQGHSENVTSVYFAPKRAGFFTSVGQDNTLKVWETPKSIEEEVQTVTSAQMTIMAH